MVGSSSWVQVSSRPTVLSLTPGITFPTDSLSSVSSSRSQTLRPLSDFGFGKKSVWEGGVWLFVVSGAVLLALSLAWLRGFQLRSRFRKYQAVLQFTEACGISTGTAVRIRGVTVGSVIRLNPSLKSIDAVIESGLLMETMIDITPKDPLPMPSMGPLDTACAKEGLIVCDKETIKGSKGVIIGVHKTFYLAERVASVIEEAKPLLAKIEAMAEDLEPFLSEVRDSGLLKEVEGLAKNLSAENASSIMTPENTEGIRKSIYSFLFTLKNIEVDFSPFTSNEILFKKLEMIEYA
ncbi:hypothetical protein MKW92_039235 [Papaver armeniacum]|nr:hypothetical protein MKW92_039235 [Papaver armeniacum]